MAGLVRVALRMSPLMLVLCSEPLLSTPPQHRPAARPLGIELILRGPEKTVVATTRRRRQTMTSYSKISTWELPASQRARRHTVFSGLGCRPLRRRLAVFSCRPIPFSCCCFCFSVCWNCRSLTFFDDDVRSGRSLREILLDSVRR